MLGDAIFLLAAITVPLLAGGLTYGLLRGSPATWSRLSWPRLLACNLLALVALASSIHLLAECYYRFWYDTTDGINVSRTSIRWFERHWSTNAQEVRDDIDYRTRIAPSQRRITFIGDSFTAAQGIADVGQRFANLVRATKLGWDVQVFAGLGWNTGDEIAKLRSIIDAGYELDTVVLVYCWNDIRPLLSDPVPPPETATTDPAERAKAAAARRKRANRHVRKFLMKHSYAINTLLHRRRRQATAKGVDEILYPERIRQAYAGEPWKAQEQLLVEFKSTVEKESGQLAVITFPWLGSLESGRYPLGVMHDRVAELFSRIDVPHLDLLPVLSPSAGSGSLVINDLDSHPSAFAHRLAAEAIVPFLEGVVSSPPRTLQRSGGGMRR